jgi:hypothetical protein
VGHHLKSQYSTRKIGKLNDIKEEVKASEASKVLGGLFQSNAIIFDKREMQGKFELIFPFNKASEELSTAINRNGGASMSGPNHMKILIQEIKKWEAEYNNYVSKLQANRNY